MLSNPYYLYPSYYPQEQALAQEKARALAQQRAYRRARRAVYLPHEEDTSDDEYSCLTPRDRLYLEARQRQEQAERRRREEEALRIKMLEARRQEQIQRERERIQQQLRARTEPNPLVSERDIPVKAPSSSPTRSRSHSTAHSPARPAAGTTPHYSEVHHEAATKIQTSYRTRRSLRTIKDLERQFNELKASLILPTTLDFQGPEGIITITMSSSSLEPTSSPSSFTLDTPIPTLSYTANNYAIHAHVEGLNRLLTKLDSVESWGESKVRKSRKEVVRRIEEQASKVESYWRRAWATYHQAMTAGSEGNDAHMEDETETEVQERQKAEEPEVQPMVVDANPEATSASPTHINSSTATAGNDPDSKALPQLDDSRESDSSDSELDFEDAEEIVMPPSKVVVALDSALDSSADDHPDSGEDSKAMVIEPVKQVNVDVDSSLGEFVMVQ